MLEAILILVLVGIIWTISGVAIGGAQRAGMSVELLLFTSYFFGCSACLLLLGFYPPIGVEGPEAWYALGMYFSVGVLNVFSSIAMGKAMERGPNSLVWAILQSGMLVPFTVGIVFHGVKASPARLLGMGLMLLALVLISAKGKEKSIGRDSERIIFSERKTPEDRIQCVQKA